jgi:hypothetical protein
MYTNNVTRRGEEGGKNRSDSCDHKRGEDVKGRERKKKGTILKANIEAAPDDRCAWNC